jgi:hypothetical protein
MMPSCRTPTASRRTSSAIATTSALSPALALDQLRPSAAAQVSSVREALMLLGVRNVRSWAL